MEGWQLLAKWMVNWGDRPCDRGRPFLSAWRLRLCLHGFLLTQLADDVLMTFQSGPCLGLLGSLLGPYCIHGSAVTSSVLLTLVV
jgi:hypothetical protein